ncbi:dockerin type I domain-containing protein [uncultured Ruminococcus sp.]|uniref:dockerin type I domain-containing protein n=1 Tax=uncultured Ruminococcus sp. TaxID=165186 RepID=UPI0025F21374|nr:dockerin type I domain-containing protein [uncultured Ruminococcus sp.]
MKSTRKAISILLTVLMLISCVSVSFTVSASTGTLCDKYATNPQGKIGVKKTITIDGSFSDWSSDMLIAQGAAWDVANHYKGGHENCVLDTYALYAAWDDNNLYVAWQMVNTTDTWAREGDGPLSDGGRVLDVPLILALSVDPSSTSMSNKNTSGGPIWGQKMGLTFNQHVDHLLYMSGKVGNGTPGMFTAVDSQGNTNYSDGLKGFKENGIEYKMAEGNICDSIIGLNYSEDTSDVYSNDADWVDYKTFKGSSGTHNTKYDSFYEIKIPLSTLGIDSSYIENNGIGAMVVATRGESGLDCIPFDDTMLDNATGSYGSDSSTSHEKDDEDVITSSFARIGNLGGDTPVTQPTTAKPTTQPTTAKPTTQPTTAKTTTAPVSDSLTVNAKSNLFATNSVKADSNADKVTVTYDLQSSMQLVNGQWSLSYDSSKLKLLTSSGNIMPYISDGVVNCKDGIVKGNFTNVTNLYNFTSSKPLIQATFEIIGSGSTDVTLDVQELSVGYKTGNSLVYKNAVVNSVKQDLSSVSGFESSSITGSASAVTDVQPTTVTPTQATTAKPTQATTQQPTTAKPTQTPTTSSSLKVNATSNFFPAVSKTYSESEKQVTVSYKLSSSIDLVNSEWTLTYDTSKLAFNSSNYKQLMPNVSSPIINENTKGKIKGNFSTLSYVDFTSESDFVTITFDVIGTGSADVDLFVNILGVAYDGADNSPVIAYIVDFGEIKDVTSISGFENEKYTVKTVLGPQTTPTTVPTTVPVTTKPTDPTTKPTQPTTKPTEPVTVPTTKPTEPTTSPVTDTLKVNATSNILSPVSQEYNKDTSTVTVSYKIKSSMELVNSQWCLTYDSSKLSFDPQKNKNSIMPNVSNAVVNTNLTNKIRGDFSSLALYDFTTEKDFVTVTFDIIGTGETTVDLDVEILGVAYIDANDEVITAYPVDYSKFFDVTSTPGFENMKLSGRITLNEPTETILYGDVNNDGVINVTDATLVQKYAADLIKLSDDELKRADVNFDGVVNVHDSTLIRKFAANIISSFK